MDVILTHSNADFDAIASLLAAHKLNPQAIPVLSERVNGNVSDFLALYTNGLPFVRQRDVRGKSIQHITLVDTQRLPELRGIKTGAPVHIIDHHVLSRDLGSNETFTGAIVGAATTLLVEEIRTQNIALTPLEATLLTLGIYEDTGSLSYGTTHPRDVSAVAWLLEQNAVLDTVRRFLSPPLKPEQRQLLESLLKNAESRLIHGHAVVVAAAVVEEYISEISSVAHYLRDLLDTSVLFVVTEMPGSTQIVCRSAGEVVDVGEVARIFGGGGHHRAAAAIVHEQSVSQIVQIIWQELERRIRPQIRIADLMSFGLQTVDASQHIRDVIKLVRRVGHEGYPVVDNGYVVGLLTQRDTARVMEHGLGDLTIREVMSSGTHTLTPDEPVSALEQLMVETGWGQIPVVDENNHPIGIVTRTDLIRYWAQQHPAVRLETPVFSMEQIATVLGSGTGSLIQRIAELADTYGKTLYLVGGVVRDLLLNRANFDIDFVVEQDAIGFAHQIQQYHGGYVSSFRPFGTAKWLLDNQVKESLAVEELQLEHIDFATARFEFYEHPTALPTVYSSSIKLDLQRRDFTINTLAVQLSPATHRGRILDFYGGQNDLNVRLIRVLHSLSFVDDPTRIIRAVRFAHRLGFTIESRTSELMATALPMLHRITGERIRNELDLLLREQTPEHGLLALAACGALTSIQPAFVIDEQIVPLFQSARASTPPFTGGDVDIVELYWHLIACLIDMKGLSELCERLMIGRTMASSMMSTAQIVEEQTSLAESSPSRVVVRLRGVPDIALYTAWVVATDHVRRIIERYMNEWRYVKPRTDGNRLREMGLQAGPRYRIILDKLLSARLDGEILTDTDEDLLLQSLLKKDERDDNL